MSTMHIAFLLDLFQPASQSHVLIDRTASECYRPLIELFRSDLTPKFSVSLANSLAIRLMECGHGDIIDELKESIKNGTVELVHTGAYHPIFPMIPERETKRQIELDIEFKTEHFGPQTKTGVFSPELGYDDKLIPLYKDLGFVWTVIDDGIMGMNGIEVPSHSIFRVDGFTVLMRSAFWSDRIRRGNGAGERLTGRQFVNHLRREIADQDQDRYMILSLSGETFGHHIKYFQETFLRDMLFALRHCEDVCLCQVSDLLTIKSLGAIDKRPEWGKGFDYFPPSSWATRPEDVERGDYFPLWCSRGNAIHEQLWALSSLIFEISAGIDFTNQANAGLRELLDVAFYSTQYFWASVWFWDPEQVNQGIDRQMRALYKCAQMTDNQAALRKGEEIYTRLMWEIHKRSRT